MNKFKSNYKKVTSLLLVIIMLFSCVSFAYPSAFAAGTEYTKDGYTYTVSGSNATIIAYTTSSSGKVTIPSKLNGYNVTTIGARAFYACTKLTEIIIPNTVTKIGDYAFSLCLDLKTCRIPSSVKSIGKDIFSLNNSVVIECSKSSYAWKYAKENGLKTKEYCTAIDNVDIYYEFDYTDELFNQTSYTYRHDLAVMSMCFTVSAMVRDGGNYSTKEPEAAKKFFDDIGFENYTPYGYNTRPQTDSIACVIGSKNVVINGVEETIIAIAIRGQGYEAEWSGNFNVGKSSTHEGFNIAKKKVLNNISEFIAKNGSKFNNNIKFWITGYSRAAATANLVASVLDNGGVDNGYHYINIESLNYQNRDVYAYTFETPLNTRAADTNASKYENIFNIVNRIDYVPKVAPMAWDYNRYGISCYLPSAETHGSSYAKLVKKMQEKYDEINQVKGLKYTENFTFYNVDLEFSWKEGFSILQPNGKIGQGRFLDEVFEVLAKGIIKNVNTYVDQYQEAVQKLIPLAMGVGVDEVAFENDDIWHEITELIEAELKDLGWDILKPAKVAHVIKHAIAFVFTQYLKDSKITYTEVYKALSIVDDVLIYGVANYDHTITLIKNAGAIKPAHFPVLCFAWMASLDGTTAESLVYETKRTYRVLTFNCPIDIEIYDEKGSLLGSIVNDKANVEDDCYLSVYIDGNGQKCICLPDDTKYQIAIKGTDVGTMSCSFTEYDFERSKNIEGVNYYDIPIDTDTEIEAIVEADSAKNIDKEVVLKDESNNVIKKSEYIDYNYASEYTIKVKSNSDSSLAVGGGDFYKGEYVKVTAVAIKCENFEGWYIDDKLVSEEEEYRFMVESDVTVEARFSKKDSHEDDDKDGKCDNCGLDVGFNTDGCSCNCHAGGIKGFFFKFLLFFQKIFRTNKTCKCGKSHY